MSSHSDSDDQEGSRLLVELTQRQRSLAWRNPTGDWNSSAAQAFGGLLSGSFNPLHAGHVELHRAAEQHLRVSVAFELPIVNADKPPLEIHTVLRRSRQFQEAPLAVTAAATFVEKALLFPGAVFVVGADTLIRILDERFYHESGGVVAALSRIEAAGCSFLVAARECQGRILTLDDLPAPRTHRRLFAELPVRLFRMDVSSTELRQSGRFD